LQDLEHGICREFAKIDLAVERIDGTEPLRNAAIVASKLFLMPKALVHFYECNRLSIEIHSLFLITTLHRMSVIGRFLKCIKKLETDHMQVFKTGGSLENTLSFQQIFLYSRHAPSAR
jgi:hypothetical protein